MKNGVFWVVTPCGSYEYIASIIRVMNDGRLIRTDLDDGNGSSYIYHTA
jgi:hypothetical protein